MGNASYAGLNPNFFKNNIIYSAGPDMVAFGDGQLPMFAFVVYQMMFAIITPG